MYKLPPRLPRMFLKNGKVVSSEVHFDIWVNTNKADLDIMYDKMISTLKSSRGYEHSLIGKDHFYTFIYQNSRN